MSDFDSSLPIRTENDGDVVVKLGDGTLPSQQLAIDASGRVTVKIQDSTGDTLDSTTGSLHVSVQNASLAVTATDLDIRDLSAAQDNVAISDGTDTLAVNADGSINVAFAPGAEIKITDGTDDLAINADGSINSVVTATNLDIRDLVFATDKVDVSGSSVTVTATDLDIRDLAFATDKVDATGSEVSLDAGTLAALESVTVQNAAGAAAVNIQDGGNSITVDGSVTVSATDLDIRDLTHVSDSVKVGDGTDFLAVNVDGSINSVVTATDLDIRDLDAAQDSVAAHLFDEAGVAFSAANPLPVSISADIAGDEINNYSTAAAVAGGASSNHDYLVSVGKTLLLKQIEAAASGKMKIEIQIETAAASGVFNSRFVQFNSTANTNMSIHLEAPISVVTGVRVRVIRTNRDNQAQDLYSTISGFEV